MEDYSLPKRVMELNVAGRKGVGQIGYGQMNEICEQWPGKDVGQIWSYTLGMREEFMKWLSIIRDQTITFVIQDIT